MMATSRTRGLKKREDRVLPEGTFSWGNLPTQENYLYRNLSLHEAWQKCIQDPTHLCHLLQIVIISKQKANRGGLQGDTWDREFEGSLPRAAQSKRTNQSMTVPNTAGRGKKGSNYLSWKGALYRTKRGFLYEGKK